MKRLFKQNYTWAIVLAVLTASFFSSKQITSAQILDNTGIVPAAASSINKDSINKGRDVVCGNNDPCKKGFNDVVSHDGTASQQFCGVDTAWSSVDGDKWCQAGVTYARSVYANFASLTESGGPCSGPIAPSAVKSCKEGFYRGLRGADNNCSGSTADKCKEAYNKGKAASATGKTGVAQAVNSTPAADAAASSSASNEPELACEDSDLGWIACPIIKSIDQVTKQMDSAINELLTVDTNKLFGTGNATANDTRVSNAYQKAWSSFRVFALGFVVIMALIVVISTAFGYEILDAYTIRKVLPRVLIAIIGITLSWSILSFLIGLTNDVGNGIRALIYAPFQGLAGKDGTTINLDEAVGVIGTFLATGTVIIFTSMGVLAFAAAALLAVLCAFMVLVLRELIIIVLVVMSPIAIACLILPNTRKYWQFWQNTLTVMLVAFPIISAMIATGKVFSMMTLAFDDNDIIYNMIALMAYILPYFMLPFAFKFAGGMLGSLGGMVNDRSRGAFDGLRKYRNNKAKQRYSDAVQGKSALGRTPLGSIYRRAHLSQQGGFSPTARGRARYRSAAQGLLDHTTAESLKNDNGRAANFDDANAAAVHATSAGDFITRYRSRVDGATRSDAISALGALEAGYGARMGTATMRSASFKAKAVSNTAYSIGKGTEEDITTMQQEMYNDAGSLVKAGLMTSADAAGAFKSNKGRADISGAAFPAMMGTIDKVAGGRQIDHFEARTLRRNALEGSEPRDILLGRHETVSVLAPEMMHQLREASVAGDAGEVNDQLASIAAKYDTMSSISPKKAKIMRDKVMSQKITYNGEEHTVQDILSNQGIRNTAKFQELRREYGSALAEGLNKPPDQS